MRILQSHEILMISGSDSGTDFVCGIGKALVCPMAFLLGTGAVGGVAGHVAGSIAGYQLASHYGASTAMSYLGGFGLGAVTFVGGAFVTAKGAEWLLHKFVLE